MRTRLATQLVALDLILKGATEDAMNRRPEQGKWSAHENLAHLARYQEIFLQRLERMLREDAPQLPHYRAEGDPEWPRWVGVPTKEILSRMIARRKELIERVNSLAPAELMRTGVHSKMGALAVLEWLEFFLTHESHHLYTIFLRVHGA
jgi:uncharacterized damage-inducible protein DinB